jgi:hypothetical protein
MRRLAGRAVLWACVYFVEGVVWLAEVLEERRLRAREAE